MNNFTLRRLLYVLLLTAINASAEDTSLQLLKHASQTKYKSNSADLTIQGSVRLEMDNVPHIQFTGMPNSDSSTGRPGAIMYSGAAGVAGLLAQILAHAAIENGMQNSAEAKAQKEADRVLAPYQAMIESITNDSIIQSCQTLCGEDTRNFVLMSNSDGTTASNPDWILESHPIFLVTQDRKNLVLRNVFVLHSKNPTKETNRIQATTKKTNAFYQNVVEIISDPCNESSPDNCWLDGVTIADVSRALFSLSMNLVTTDILHKFINPEDTDHTFRYMLGNSSSFERGKLLASESGRLTVRTLRGWIKSVPVEQTKPENNLPSAASAITTDK